MTIGDIIKEFRAGEAMSQRKFAELSKLSNSYISMLEKNANSTNGAPIKPSLDTLVAVSGVMRVALPDLLRRLNEKIESGISNRPTTFGNGKGFGDRLRERRETLKLKQSELGELLEVTGSAIGNYENGVSFPRADVLYRMFDILQCDANFLFQDEMSFAGGDTTENILLNMCRKLNEEGQEKLLVYADDLLQSGKYI